MPEQEIIPPEKRPSTQIGASGSSKKAFTLVRWGAIVALFTWAGWCFQNYLSVHGIVNMTMARINLVIACVLFCAAVWLATVNNKYKKQIRWFVCICVFLAAFIMEVFVAQQPPAAATSVSQSAFGIVRGASWVAPEFSNSLYWVPFPSTLKITPAHVLAFYTITNAKPTPVMISNLSLEMSGSHGMWWPLINLPTMVPIWAADFKDPTDVHSIEPMEGFLIEKIRKVELKPGQTVQGWLPCQLPTDFAPSSGIMSIQVRLHIKDTAGDDQTEPPQYWNVGGNIIGNGFLVKPIPGVDLREYEVITYGQ